MQTDLTRYLPTFLLVAEELSFSATARRVGVTPAAVGKSVRMLEEGLGVRLFHRSTHALAMTAEGEQLRARVAPLVDALQDSLASAQALPKVPRGRVRVVAPYSVGTLKIVPILHEFRRLYPEVELDLRFEDHFIDLVKAQVDVAVGVRVDPSPNLIAKKLFETRTLTLAAPEFLERHGTPTHPSDLERFPCIRYRSLSTGRLLPWTYMEGERQLTYNPPAALSVTSLEIVAALVSQQLGLGLTGYTSAAPYLANGSVVEILKDFRSGTMPMMLYYMSRQNLPSSVRVFIDHVSRHLGGGGAKSAM